MAITPDDIDNKRFTAVRLKEGYSMEEVDAFLDEISVDYRKAIDLSASAQELQNENDSLRGQLEDVQAQLQAAQEEVSSLQARVADAEAAAENARSEAASAPAITIPEAKPEVETFGVAWPPAPVETTAQASEASRRLLHIAAETADKLVTEAHAEAQEVRSGAQEEATGLVSSAHETRAHLLAEVETERAAVEEVIESLKAFEADYRHGLTQYFSAQLDAVRGVDVLGEVAAARGEEVPAEEALPVTEDLAAGNDTEEAPEDFAGDAPVVEEPAVEAPEVEEPAVEAPVNQDYPIEAPAVEDSEVDPEAVSEDSAISDDAAAEAYLAQLRGEDEEK